MESGMAKVIVATEQEQTVRIYVGVPSNGGMDQTAQFISRSPIEPTALADMAVGLANQFGWLQTESVSVSPAINGKTNAIADATTEALPAAKALTPSDKAKRELVACGICRKQLRRKALAHHMEALHGSTPENARRVAKSRPAIVASEDDAPQPIVTKTARKESTNDVWKQRIECPVPGCGQVATRSNMARHLMSTKPNHGYRHSDATAAVRIGNATKAKRSDNRANRQGLHGARILEQEILPGVLAAVRESGTMTSAELAKRYSVNTGTALSWLRKLEAKGELVDVTPGSVIGQAKSFAVPAQAIGIPMPGDAAIAATLGEFAGPVTLPNGSGMDYATPTGSTDSETATEMETVT